MQWNIAFDIAKSFDEDQFETSSVASPLAAVIALATTSA